MKVIRSINIEEKLWKKLQEIAKKENRSASNFIEYLKGIETKAKEKNMSIKEFILNAIQEKLEKEK